MKERSLALAAIAAVAILVDCGGGGGGGSAVAPTSGAIVGATSTPGLQAPAGTLKASMTITIPAAPSGSSSSRRIKMVPSNTKSIIFTLAQTNGTGLAPGTVQGPFGLTSTSPGCSVATNGNVTCTLSINAPVGSDIFTADIYSSINAAAGTQLGSGAVQFSVAQNAANTASISLNGPISQIILASNCPTSNVINYFNFLNACVLGDVGYFNSFLLSSARKPAVAFTPPPAPFLNTVRVFVIALDSSGSVIVNPTVYDQPVTLELIGQPLLSLTATYAGISLPFTNNAASASTSTNGGTVQLWSPLDVATLAIIPNATGYVQGYLFSGIGTAVPVPFSSSLPSPNPSATPGPFLYVGAAVNPGATPTPPPTPTPTPTPTPVPTASPGPLTWVNTAPTSAFVFNAVNGLSDPTKFTVEFGAPEPMPSSAPVTTAYTFGLQSNYAFAGSYTIADGGSLGPCLGGGILSSASSPVAAAGAPFTPATVTLFLQTTSSASCSLVATDGTYSSELDIYVNQASITVQGRKRK